MSDIPADCTPSTDFCSEISLLTVPFTVLALTRNLLYYWSFFFSFSCFRCIQVVTETHTCRFIGTETCFVPTDFFRQKNSPQYTIASFVFAFVLFIYLYFILQRKNWQNEKILFDFKRLTFLVQFCIWYYIYIVYMHGYYRHYNYTFHTSQNVGDTALHS